MQVKIKISDGQVKYIYNDAIRPLEKIGKTEIRRASHVEPNAEGKWTADLTPSNGPILGPFEKREDALKAEVEWLERNM